MQLDSLDKVILDYVESEPYGIADERYEGDDGIVYLLYEDVRDPDIMLGVMFGEILHNLRSALDQLVWQLVLLNDRTPCRWNAFPVCVVRKVSKVDPKRPAWTRDWPSKLKGVSRKHRALINAVQPYHGRGGFKRKQLHPLMLLTDLWNTDKHRIVHPSIFTVPEGVLPGDLTVDFGGYPAVRAEIFVCWGPVEDDADALGVRITDAPLGVPKYVNVQGEFPLDVEFGERQVSTRRLRSIGRFIAEEIFEKVAPDFSEDVPIHGFSQDMPLPRGGVEAEQLVKQRDPADTDVRLGQWKVWLGLEEPLERGPLYWQFENEQEVHLVSVEGSSADFRRTLETFLSPDEIESVFAFFEPVEQLGPLGSPMVLPS